MLLGHAKLADFSLSTAAHIDEIIFVLIAPAHANS